MQFTLHEFAHALSKNRALLRQLVEVGVHGGGQATDRLQQAQLL